MQQADSNLAEFPSGQRAKRIVTTLMYISILMEKKIKKRAKRMTTQLQCPFPKLAKAE